MTIWCFSIGCLNQLILIIWNFEGLNFINHLSAHVLSMSSSFGKSILSWIVIIFVCIMYSSVKRLIVLYLLVHFGKWFPVVCQSLHELRTLANCSMWYAWVYMNPVRTLANCSRWYTWVYMNPIRTLAIHCHPLFPSF